MTKRQMHPKIKHRKWAFRHRMTSSLRVVFDIVLGGIFFGAVFFMFLYFLMPALEQKQGTDKPAAAQADPVDSFNMLPVTDDNNDTPVQIMLLRLDASRGHIYVTPVPTELSVSENGEATAISQLIKEDDLSDAVSALEKAAGIKIEYRCLLKADEISNLIAIFGGFVYTVPYSISDPSPQPGFAANIQAGSNVIDDKKALTLMSYAGYEGGAQKRYEVQAGMMKSFIEQKLTVQSFDDTGDSFKNIFNMVQTNFSLVDLLDKSDSFRAIVNRKDFAVSILPSYSQSRQNGETLYRLDAKTKSQIRKYFSQ